MPYDDFPCDPPPCMYNTEKRNLSVACFMYPSNHENKKQETDKCRSRFHLQYKETLLKIYNINQHKGIHNII